MTKQVKCFPALHDSAFGWCSRINTNPLTKVSYQWRPCRATRGDPIGGGKDRGVGG
jgi:hypothetical protein